MPAVRKNSATGVPAEGAEAAAPAAGEPEAPNGPSDGAQSAGVEPGEPGAAEPPGPVRLRFVGPIPLVVTWVGPCEPGDVMDVPAHVADLVCAGDHKLFERVAAA